MCIIELFHVLLVWVGLSIRSVDWLACCSTLAIDCGAELVAICAIEAWGWSGIEDGVTVECTLAPTDMRLVPVRRGVSKGGLVLVLCRIPQVVYSEQTCLGVRVTRMWVLPR